MQTQSSPSSAPLHADCDLTVYHDGACPICSVEIGHYQKLSGAERIRFVDASIADQSASGEGLDRTRALQRFHVRLPDGRLVSGAKGFAMLWQTLPRYRGLGRVAQFPVILQSLEILYRLVLPVRSVLSGVIRRVRQS